MLFSPGTANILQIKYMLKEYQHVFPLLLNSPLKKLSSFFEPPCIAVLHRNSKLTKKFHLHSMPLLFFLHFFTFSVFRCLLPSGIHVSYAELWSSFLRRLHRDVELPETSTGRETELWIQTAQWFLLSVYYWWVTTVTLRFQVMAPAVTSVFCIICTCE